jgi:alkanesulfonate monooxygenase SsuD/methylene tetrahydromethanopterin reductase-like flavin-dependent oxidoreductase (luciferase family)
MGDPGLLIEAATLAEQVGFESVWCYDHLSGSVLGGGESLDVWSMLAAIAVATEHVSIGPMVVNVTTRHAAHIAVSAATVQSLCAGRLHLGLGAGASRPSSFAGEMEMFHFAQDSARRRRARVIETVGFLRALWAGSVSFHGEWASFDDVSGVAIPRPHCPIVIGANGPKMAALAGRYADGVNFHSWESDLGSLIATALNARSVTDNGPFSVSIEGPWEPEWLDPCSPTRCSLTNLGVTDVILRWNPEIGLDPIRRAAQSRGPTAPAVDRKDASCGHRTE